MSPIFQVYCCARSSDRGRLDTDLLSSPEIKNGKVGLTILWNQASAGAAYSRAIKTATAKVLVFAHCDVYFPQGWFERLEWELDRLSRIDSEWAVAGVGSITPSGEIVGRIFDTSLEPVFRQSLGVFGKPLTTPVRIASADELVIIVRRASGVSFDPLLPEFHFYGTATDLTCPLSTMQRHNSNSETTTAVRFGIWCGSGAIDCRCKPLPSCLRISHSRYCVRALVLVTKHYAHHQLIAIGAYLIHALKRQSSASQTCSSPQCGEPHYISCALQPR